MLKEKKRKKEREEIISNYKFLSFYLQANSAATNARLNSLFGSLGLKGDKFCKEFNKLTEDFKSYFLLKVYLKIDLSTRSWVIKLGRVPITYLFRIISLKKKKKYYGSGGFYFKLVSYIKLIDFFLVLLFFNLKLNDNEIRNKLSILKSMNIMVLK